MKDYICEVSGEEDEAPPRIVRVNAPSEEMAQLLAFAIDGGLGPSPDHGEPAQTWGSMIELAKMYVTVRLAE